jgi:hypothetical protein
LPSEAEEPLFSGARIHVAIDRLLRAIALVVIGVPMHRVEQLLGIKAETVKRRLESLLEEDQWEVLDHVLEDRYRIPELHHSEFSAAIVVGRQQIRSAFRCWSKELRRRDRRDIAKDLRLIGRIVGRKVTAAEIVPQH